MDNWLYTGQLPVNMLADAESEPQNDPTYDMVFGIFPDSGVIQLLDLVPEEMIYVDTHSNAVGGIWKRQHEQLAALIGESNPENILEIGGGNWCTGKELQANPRTRG